MSTILVSAARSGSQLVQMSIAQHPQLKVWGEVLCDVAAGYSDEMRDFVKDWCGYRIASRSDPVDKSGFGDRVAYLDAIDKHGVQFYKLLYSHMNPRVSRWSKTQNVIHLVRENPLAVAASNVLAKQAKQWNTPVGQTPPDHKPVNIRPADVRMFRRLQERHRQRYWYALTIQYGELVSDWDGTMRRIQRAAGVTPIELPPVLTKSVRRPLRELIANVDELEAAGFGEYLDERGIA